MNCNYLTKTNTASLYKNNNLLVRASSEFTIRCCNNIDLELGYNRCCNCTRVCAFIRNMGECDLKNVLVRFSITKDNNCCNCACCNKKVIKEVCLYCLGVNCVQRACIDLPRMCNQRQLIKVEVISNCQVLKEDFILV